MKINSIQRTKSKTVLNRKEFVIEQMEEYRIPTFLHERIGLLLQSSFPDYPINKSYFNQIPSFRYLAWYGDELIGHLGVVYRIISLNGVELRVFGIVDLCVDAAFQSMQIGSNILKQLESLAEISNIDFMILISDAHSFYLEQGFIMVDNPGKWLMIRNSQTLGIAHRKLSDCLMVKPIGTKQWDEGTVDFLGNIF